MPTPSLSKLKCIDQGNIWESIRKSMTFAQPTKRTACSAIGRLQLTKWKLC